MGGTAPLYVLCWEKVAFKFIFFLYSTCRILISLNVLLNDVFGFSVRPVPVKLCLVEKEQILESVPPGFLEQRPRFLNGFFRGVRAPPIFKGFFRGVTSLS